VLGLKRTTTMSRMSEKQISYKYMKRKAKSEISDSAAKALKLQTRFVIIKMPVRQVIHSYLSSFLYPASTGSCFMKARQRKEKNKKYLKERYEEKSGSFSCLFFYVCPAKLDYTCRCKSGHGNRQ